MEGPRGGESSRLLFCSESVDYSSSKTRKVRNDSTSMLFRNMGVNITLVSASERVKRNREPQGPCNL